MNTLTRPKQQRVETADKTNSTFDKIVRLSINLSSDTAAALRELAEHKGTSVTEAVRRAIAVWKFVEDEVAQGHRIAVIDKDGDGHDRIREVVLVGG